MSAHRQARASPSIQLFVLHDVAPLSRQSCVGAAPRPPVSTGNTRRARDRSRRAPGTASRIDQWYTQTWTIADAQFVGKWGYQFTFDSDATQNSKYTIQSVTVAKQ
jgi:hypothetical protein